MRYAFVLWNRDRYPKMYDYIDKIKSGESVEETWLFQDNAISEGDRVFVYSSVKTAQGFIAAGHAMTERYIKAVPTSVRVWHSLFCVWFGRQFLLLANPSLTSRQSLSYLSPIPLLSP